MIPRQALAPLLTAFCLLGCSLFGFLDERVHEGEAYGFVIGETFPATLTRARDMKRSGTIAEIEFGSGSGAVPFDGNTHTPSPSQKLQLVVDPDVWNDTIYLTFARGTLAEIWRFRSPTELP